MTKFPLFVCIDPQKGFAPAPVPFHWTLPLVVTPDRHPPADKVRQLYEPVVWPVVKR